MQRYSGLGMRIRQVAVLLAGAGMLTAAGCGGSTGPKTGSLTVTINGPGGVTPNVTVSGPGGYNKALTATTTLTGLAVGSYAVGAAPVTNANTIVPAVYTGSVTGSPASVTAGATASATAAYAQRPGTGGVWVANFGAATLIQYTAAQLASSTSAAAATAVATPSAQNNQVAFDANGNVWVANGNNAIFEFTASQLATSGNPTPAVTLAATGSSLSIPINPTFDASGNLWVSNVTNNTVVEFTASQLASSGNPVPAVVLGASSGSLSGPYGMAFDANGNLWVANNTGNTIVAFTPSQLAASGTPTPTVILTNNAGSIVNPIGLAFDPNGNLWYASFTSAILVEFTPAQLAASGNPAPAVVITSSGGSLNAPSFLAFDASANLWVTNAGGTVVEFAASQLVSSGNPTPNVTVSGTAIVEPQGIAFDPHAANLPLKP
jgi:sugar lactone lactonase YvrE